MGFFHQTKLLHTNHLEVLLDASDSVSYPNSGSIWHDLTGNGNYAKIGDKVVHTSGSGFDDKFICFNNASASALTDQSIESQTTTAKGQWGSSTFELVYTDRDGNPEPDNSAWGFDNGAVNSNGVRFQGSAAQIWTGASLQTSLSYSESANDFFTHIMMTTDGNDFKIYVDGNLKASNTPSNSHGNANISRYHLNSKLRTVSNNGWDGDYAILRMYSVPFTAQEVKHNFDVTRLRFGV